MRVAVIADPGPEWDAFVEAEPAGQLGHASAWARVVREAYGLKPVYLEARNEQGAIAGILPLVLFRGLSAGLELVSMPFLDSGGILTRDPATERALIDAALELVRDQGASALELREIAVGGGVDGVAGPAAWKPGRQRQGDYNQQGPGCRDDKRLPMRAEGPDDLLTLAEK